MNATERHKVAVPPLWGVYSIDPEDGEAAWISLPQIPGEPTIAFNSEPEAKAFAVSSAKQTGFPCHVGRLNSAVGTN